MPAHRSSGLFTKARNLLSGGRSNGSNYTRVAADEDEDSGPVMRERRSEYESDRDYIEAGTGLLNNNASRRNVGRSSGKPVSVCRVVLISSAIGTLLMILLWRVLKQNDNDGPTVSPIRNKVQLEDMPEFGNSLSCSVSSAPYIHGIEKQVFTVPIGQNKKDMYVNVRGGAVGTIVLAQQPGSDATSENVDIELTLRGSSKEILDDVLIDQYDSEISANPYWRLNTPRGLGNSCMRYDITVRLPRTLKRFHVASHSVSHIMFAEEGDSNDPLLLDNVFVTFFSPKSNNMLLPNSNIAARRMSLEMQGGWMVGSVALVNETRLLTQRGDARSHMEVITLPSKDATSTLESPLILQTVTGVGRSDFTVLNNDIRQHHHPIQADHLVSGNGELYLHYENAFFNGAVNVFAETLATHGTGNATLTPTPNTETKPGTDGKMIVGDKNGQDSLKISSRRGRVELWV